METLFSKCVKARRTGKFVNQSSTNPKVFWLLVKSVEYDTNSRNFRNENSRSCIIRGSEEALSDLVFQQDIAPNKKIKGTVRFYDVLENEICLPDLLQYVNPDHYQLNAKGEPENILPEFRPLYYRKAGFFNEETQQHVEGPTAKAEGQKIYRFKYFDEKCIKNDSIKQPENLKAIQGFYKEQRELANVSTNTTPTPPPANFVDLANYTLKQLIEIAAANNVTLTATKLSGAIAELDKYQKETGIVLNIPTFA